jgi:hypothetical protein
MSTIPSLQGSLAGIDRCWRKMERIADNVGNVGNEKREIDLAHEFAGMIETRSALSANLQTVRIVDEMTRSLIDIKA